MLQISYFSSSVVFDCIISRGITFIFDPKGVVDKLHRKQLNFIKFSHGKIFNEKQELRVKVVRELHGK